MTRAPPTSPYTISLDPLGPQILQQWYYLRPLCYPMYSHDQEKRKDFKNKNTFLLSDKTTSILIPGARFRVQEFCNLSSSLFVHHSLPDL